MLNTKKQLLQFLMLASFLLLQTEVSSQTISAKQVLDDTISVVGNDNLISRLRIGDLKKKYIIVDFWATWCAPCIENHKKLEKVYAKHSDSLTIITICGDSYQHFSRFNADWKTDFIKGLDTGNVVFTKHHVSIIPTMFFINTETMKINVASGALLSEKLFQSFVRKGGKILDSLPKYRDVQDVFQEYFSEQQHPKGMVIETKYIPNSSSFLYYRAAIQPLGYRKVYANFSIAAVYKDCYKMSEVRAIYGYNDDLESYSCFELGFSQDDKRDPDKIMIDYLESNHPEIEAKVVKRVADSCYVLERIPDRKICQPTSDTPDGSIAGNAYSGKNVSIQAICFFLEEQLRIPVENLVGSKYCSFALEYHYGDFSDLNKQLGNYGLKLTKDRNRKIDYLLLRKHVLSLN